MKFHTGGQISGIWKRAKGVMSLFQRVKTVARQVAFKAGRVRRAGAFRRHVQARPVGDLLLRFRLYPGVTFVIFCGNLKPRYG